MQAGAFKDVFGYRENFDCIYMSVIELTPTIANMMVKMV